ncbi:MAG: type VI secretion system tube protein Hcp [Sphingobacteriales bacterium]|nr:MAG: type VI secretion system tube protein Hcp [Sphingobacteriales bacterium]
MKKVIFIPLLLLSTFCFSQMIQMQINGLTGNGDMIPIYSFSWGASNPVTVGSGSIGVGKVSISSFNLMKQQDAATIKMIEAIATGKHFTEATVTVMNDKGQPSFRYTMKDVLIESIQHSHSDCGNKKCDNITESVSLACARWKWEDLATGKSFEYNVATNSAQ